MANRGYFGAALDAFRHRHGMDDAHLAQCLGCGLLDLLALRNHVHPDHASPNFEVEVERIARSVRCSATRLRSVLLETQSATAASATGPDFGQQSRICQGCSRTNPAGAQ